MRGGGVAHGPDDRSHAYALPKKLRQLGMKHALSSKVADGKIFILSKCEMKDAKTAEFTKSLKAFGDGSFLIIDGDKVNENAKKATSNLHHISLLPQIGANVYDIIKYDYLMLTKDAVTALEKRLKNA
jgi:large subunit ribosomal protein L4